MDNKIEEAEDLLNADPVTGEPGAHPAETSIGAVSGALAGVAIGAAAGPLGAVAGAAIGGVAGGLAGKAAGEVIDPTKPPPPEFDAERLNAQAQAHAQPEPDAAVMQPPRPGDVPPAATGQRTPTV